MLQILRRDADRKEGSIASRPICARDILDTYQGTPDMHEDTPVQDIPGNNDIDHQDTGTLDDQFEYVDNPQTSNVHPRPVKLWKITNKYRIIFSLPARKFFGTTLVVVNAERQPTPTNANQHRGAANSVK